VIGETVAAVQAGKPVIVPTDTVYGLCCTPYREEPVRRLYRLKERPEEQPIALIASDLEMLFECVPELRGRSGVIARALLPGPLTLIFPNPARRYRWLTGTRPETIGVRVPELTGAAAEVLERVGCLAGTSANLSGQPDPRRLADVPEKLRAACAAVLDGGELGGEPSTVLDFTAAGEPRLVREGAVPGEEALARAAQVLA
jgi:L-threonylcarbamoyladenylate synthase